MSGGTIQINNPSGVTLAVAITPVAGAATFLKSGGGTASFPESVTAASETFTTTSDGQYTLSVKYAGVEVAASPDGTYLVELRNGCLFAISPTPDLGFEFFAPSTTTSAALEAVGNAINTTGKYTGKLVWNTTTGLPLWADGPAAADTWSLATGVATHSPI